MSENKVQTFYEQEAKKYDATRFKTSHGVFADFVQKSAVLELLGNCQGKRILEIGSGTGRFTKELVKRGATVVCVDLSRPMHEQSRIAIYNTNVQYFVMSGLDLGFANETFDICLTINMMSHIKDESRIFNEVHRVLKKEGFFLANFPNMSGLYFPIGALVNLFERSLQVPVYSKWYTVGKLTRSFKTNSFVPEQRLGRMIFPKKYCPAVLFKLLNAIDRLLRNPTLSILYGDLFVKLRPLT